MFNPTPPSCPVSAELSGFVSGELSGHDHARIARHLVDCAPCQQSVAVLIGAGDPLVRRARRHVGTPSPTPGGTPGPGDGRTPDTGPAPDGWFGAYQLLEKIGEGGMGVVFKAYDTELNRVVALKLIRRDLATPAGRERFVAEGHALAQVQHPNIVQVFRAGEADGVPYCALEYVAGGSLDRRVREEGISPRGAAVLVEQIARGVQAAHDHNLVHRDLKPANVLLYGAAGQAIEACVPKVTDFGLVKFLNGGRADQTAAGVPVGTPAYMAPEQAAGRAGEVTPSADVYALGATLYDLLCGRPPFKGSNLADLLVQVCEQDPPPPRRIQPGVPRDLEAVCLKCLQKDPAGRYPSAAALADDLRRFLAGEPTVARPVGVPGRAWRWCRRKPAVAALAAVAVLAVAGLVAGGFRYAYEIGTAKAEVAEKEADRRAAEARTAEEAANRRAAEERERRAAEVARLNEYHALVNRARETIVERNLGWTWQALADLEAAARIPIAGGRDPAGLRSALASCLAGADAREKVALAPGFAPWSVAFHPNGRWVLLAQARNATNLPVGSMDVRVVDFHTRQPVRTLTFPPFVNSLTDPRPDQVRSLAISPDGRWVVAGTRSGRLHRWNLDDPTPAAVTWSGGNPAGGCDWVEFSANGESLYAASTVINRPDARSVVTRWNVGRWVREAIHEREGSVFGMAVSPAGRWVAIATPNAIRFLAADALKEEWVYDPQGGPGALAAAPDGATLAYAARDSIHLLDVPERKLVRTLRESDSDRAHAQEITTLRFDPSGRLLASGSEWDMHVKLWDVCGGRRVADWRAEGAPAAPAFDPSGRFVGVAAPAAKVFEVGGFNEHQTAATHGHQVLGVALTPDGRTLACTARSLSNRRHAALSVWDLDAPARPRPRVVPDGVKTGMPGNWSANEAWVAIDPTGERIAGTAWNWLESDDLSREGPPLLRVNVLSAGPVRFGPGGRLWVLDDTDVAVHVAGGGVGAVRWSNALAAKISGLGTMRSLAVGRAHAVAGGGNGALRLFDAAVPPGAKSLSPVKTQTVEPRIAVLGVALDPAEQLALATTETGRGYLVNLPDLAVRAAWRPHADAAPGAVFLGGGVFATGGHDRAVRFWRRAGEGVEELFTLRTPAGVRELAASADGRRLVVLCEGEYGVRRWELADLWDRFAAYGVPLAEPFGPK